MIHFKNRSTWHCNWASAACGDWWRNGRNRDLWGHWCYFCQLLWERSSCRILEAFWQVSALPNFWTWDAVLSRINFCVLVVFGDQAVHWPGIETVAWPDTTQVLHLASKGLGCSFNIEGHSDSTFHFSTFTICQFVDKLLETNCGNRDDLSSPVQLFVKLTLRRMKLKTGERQVKFRFFVWQKGNIEEDLLCCQDMDWWVKALQSQVWKGDYQLSQGTWNE
jgi:hypothetical protein